jgi:glycosyltransferase involved in cell wall biosynthesis
MELSLNKILAIVPAFNEEENIASVISDLNSIDIPIDILVVNDASVDNTSLAARSAGGSEIIDLPVNLGIGGAVQTGFKYAMRNGYDIAIQFDGDGQHKAREIKKLLGPIMAGEADIVIGSRFLGGGVGFRSTFTRRLGIRLLQAISRILIREKITDNTSGFRAYNRGAFEFLSDFYPEDYPEPESVVLLGKKGFKILEVLVVMGERRGGESSIHGLLSLYYMIKVVLSMLVTFTRKKSNGGGSHGI